RRGGWTKSCARSGGWTESKHSCSSWAAVENEEEPFVSPHHGASAARRSDNAPRLFLFSLQDYEPGLAAFLGRELGRPLVGTGVHGADGQIVAVQFVDAVECFLAVGFEGDLLHLLARVELVGSTDLLVRRLHGNLAVGGEGDRDALRLLFGRLLSF